MVSRSERVGRASPLTRGCPPPFVYPLASLFPLSLALARRRCCRFCGPGFSSCCLADGYAPPIGIAPVFFDSLCARYAQRRIICSRRGGSCARLTVRYCHVGRVVVCGGVARVGAWGSSGVLLGCERGRVSVSLVFFFEETTMPERGGTKGAHPGSTRMLLNERTIRHHRVNAGANKREIRKQGEAVTCR